jgi:O-antigen ligase
MPPPIALLLCILFILFLFITDIKREPPVPRSLWVPWIWMMLIGSRPLTFWLNPSRFLHASPEELLAPSPIDRITYIVIELAGLYILSTRTTNWSRIFKKNLWLFMFLFYCGISILWSDFPSVTLIRWMKITVHFVIVLVLLTEPDPIESIKAMIRRYAYVAIPLSIVFIKYYPHIGRTFHPWTGLVAYCGISYGKNSLGYISMICGIFFFWNLLTIWRQDNTRFNKMKYIAFLLMISWLLHMADSATSLACFVVGILILLGLSTIRHKLRYIQAYTVALLLILVTLHLTVGLLELALPALNRDITFTGRTELWKEVLAMDINPLLGTGYQSFWWGPRLDLFWEKYWWVPNQAHNGYIETYLNLGAIGLFILIAIIVTSYRRICTMLLTDFAYARLRMALLVSVLLYNVTEAGFKGLHFMFFVFIFVVAESLPKRSTAIRELHSIPSCNGFRLTRNSSL